MKVFYNSYIKNNDDLINQSVNFVKSMLFFFLLSFWLTFTIFPFSSVDFCVKLLDKQINFIYYKIKIAA